MAVPKPDYTVVRARRGRLAHGVRITAMTTACGRSFAGWLSATTPTMTCPRCRLLILGAR